MMEVDDQLGQTGDGGGGTNTLLDEPSIPNSPESVVDWDIWNHAVKSENEMMATLLQTNVELRSQIMALEEKNKALETVLQRNRVLETVFQEVKAKITTAESSTNH